MLFEENFTIFVVSYGAICGTRHVESVTLSFYISVIGGWWHNIAEMEQTINKDEQLKKDIKSELLGKTGYLKPNHIPYTCKQVTGNITFLSHQPKDYNESSIDEWTEIKCGTQVTGLEQGNEIPIETPGLIAKFHVSINYQQSKRSLTISNISLSEHPDD